MNANSEKLSLFPTVGRPAISLEPMSLVLYGPLSFGGTLGGVGGGAVSSLFSQGGGSEPLSPGALRLRLRMLEKRLWDFEGEE